MFGKRSTAPSPLPPPSGTKPAAPAPSAPESTATPALNSSAAPAAPASPAPPKQPPAPPRSKMSQDKNEQINSLKVRLHRKLISQLDLTRLVGDDEIVRDQVREVLSGLLDQENTLLSFNDRQKVVDEVLDETFGLGPLEILLSDPTISDILVNGPKQVYVERHGRLSITDVASATTPT